MTRSIIKTTKLFRFFLEGVRLRHSVLLVYNERTFSQPRYLREEPCIRDPLATTQKGGGSAAFGRRPLSVYPPRRVFAPQKSFESR